MQERMDVSESYLKESIGVGLSLKGDWFGCQVGMGQQKKAVILCLSDPFHCRIYIHIVTFYITLKSSLQSSHFTSTSMRLLRSGSDLIITAHNEY